MEGRTNYLNELRRVLRVVLRRNLSGAPAPRANVREIRLEFGRVLERMDRIPWYSWVFYTFLVSTILFSRRIGLHRRSGALYRSRVLVQVFFVAFVIALQLLIPKLRPHRLDYTLMTALVVAGIEIVRCVIRMRTRVVGPAIYLQWLPPPSASS